MWHFVSPQPYNLIEQTLYHCVPLRGYNKLLSYHHTYNHSYKKLHGQFCTHEDDFEFWYFTHISAVVQTHESGYSSNDRSPQGESFSLLQHLSITFLSKVIKGYLIFPYTLFDTTMTPSHKNYQTIQDLYNG